MRNKEYRVRGMRLDNKVWEKLKFEQAKSGQSWNLFIRQLLEEYVNNRGIGGVVDK